MSYQISYDNGNAREKNKVHAPEKRKILFRFLVAVVMCTAGVLLLYKGKDRIWEVLVPGDPQITEKALSTMADGIRKGESIKEAIAAFCREIILNAGITK